MRATVPAVAACLLALTGCQEKVQVSALPHATSDQCRAAAEAYPGSVLGQERRPTTDDASAAAGAWGDLAIVARCGGEPPAPTTDTCVTVNGVDWVMTDLSDGKRFVTYGRRPALEVLVPHAHAPEPEALPAFAEAAQKLPTTGNRCR